MHSLEFPIPDNEYYLDHYIAFINNIRKKRDNIRIGYMEDHHIIPKSLFDEGDTRRDLPENRIYLTPREHYIAHKLLARAYYHDHKIVSAFWYMSNNGRHEVTSAEYAEARERDFLRNIVIICLVRIIRTMVNLIIKSP